MKVSIIIPMYNVEKYLKDCIESIINQTYKNLEIICINDGSTDSTLEIITKYKNMDSRIIVINQENKGLLASRLVGLEIATGNFVLNVDSDDYIEENTIELLIEKIKKYNCDVIRFNMFENDTIKVKTSYNDFLLNKNDFEPKFYDLFFKTYTLNSACGQIFKREKYNLERKIEERISMGEDIVYNINLYPYISNILFIDDHLYHYRVNYNSITRINNIQSIMNNTISAYNAYIKMYNSINDFNIKDKTYYTKIVSTRLMIEIFYIELKLLNLTNKKNNIEIKKFIEDINNKIKNNFIDKNTNLYYILKNSRRHKLYCLFMYKKMFFFAKVYATTIYRFGLKIRGLKNELFR